MSDKIPEWEIIFKIQQLQRCLFWEEKVREYSKLTPLQEKSSLKQFFKRAALKLWQWSARDSLIKSSYNLSILFPRCTETAILWALGLPMPFFYGHILKFHHATALLVMNYFFYLPVCNCQWHVNFCLSSTFRDCCTSLWFGRNGPRVLAVRETHEETCSSREEAGKT